jgi:hypothetical protein
MNTLLLAIVGLAAFVCVGGSRVPSVLRQNKGAIVGVAIGIVLSCVFGVRLEDGSNPGECGEECEEERLKKSAAATEAAAHNEMQRDGDMPASSGFFSQLSHTAGSIFGSQNNRVTS